MVLNSFYLKHLSMTTGNFWTYCGQSLAGLCLFTEFRYRTLKKTCSENFIDYFSHSKNGMVKCVTPKIFQWFWILRYSQIKKVVVHSKPFIKAIDILLLKVRFVKSSDQTIIQIMNKKNKSILIFLFNPSNCFTGTYLNPSQHLR